MALQRYLLRGVELALRTELAFSRVRRRATFVAAAALAGALVLVPGSVSAEGLFDFLFGGDQKQQRRGRPPRRRTSSPIRSASISQPIRRRTCAARRGLRTCLLRAKLRRQVFSADHARQRLAGSDLPGVLPGQRHQSILRQQHRQRGRGQWRALCRQRKRLRLSQGAARRLHLQRPKPVRAGAGRSHARHLAALRRRRSPPPTAWWPIPAFA